MPRYRNWVFTWNNYTAADRELLCKAFENLKSQFVFQEETGENGTPHLQGVVFFQNQRELSTLKKISRAIHWERMRGKKEQAVAYCTKAETRTGEVFTNMKLPRQLVSPLAGKELYGWQSDIQTAMEGEPDDRTILWVWDEPGCSGKTAFAKHLAITRPGRMLYVNGAGKDVYFAIAQALEKNTELDTVVFGYPRSKEQYVSYAALESVKDGFFFSSKYESGMVVFPCPHVLVLANFAPKRNELSRDRWEVYEIGGDHELILEP